MALTKLTKVKGSTSRQLDLQNTATFLTKGDLTKVAFMEDIATASTPVENFEYLLYYALGEVSIWSVGDVTGTLNGDFDPETGSDSGLSGTLESVVLASTESVETLASDISTLNDGLTNLNDELTSLDNEVDLYKQSVPIPLIDNVDDETILTDTQNLYGSLVLTGTLTKEQELVVSDNARFLTVTNETNYAIKVKTDSGTGVHVEIGEQFDLRVESGNVVNSGINNKIIALEYDTYTTGTYTYPFLLNQSQADRLKILASPTLTSEVSGTTGEVTSSQINTYSTTWQCSIATTSGNNAIIQYTSTSSFSVSTLSNDSIKSVEFYLKDGVTY